MKLNKCLYVLQKKSHTKKISLKKVNSENLTNMLINDDQFQS